MIKNIEKFNKTIFWFSLGLALLTLLFSVSLVSFLKAAGASLSIFPQTGSFTVGSTFDVSIFVNTGGNNVNVVRVDLKFDPEKLQVLTPAKGISAVEEWIFPPSFSNTKGTIALQGGFPGRGINTSEGLITVIVFKAISTGKTEVHFLDSSKVLVGKEEGINILTSVNRGAYNIIPSPPKGPRIFSETHPDQNKWYKNPNPSFSWNKIEGAEGYSYQINDDPFGEPNNLINTKSTSISFEEINEGVQYFHLKAKKADLWGGTSHFKIMIDKTLPSEFIPHLEPFSFTSDSCLLVYFNTRDLLSGIEHYQVRVADYTDPQNIVWSGWIREESPFRLSTEKRGVFQVFVRAFDKAGNFREEKIQVKIFNPILVIVGGGIQIKGLFLPWWLVSLLLGIVFFGIGYLIFKRLKKRPGLARVDLEKEIKEAEKEIEDVRKAKEKLRRMRILEERGREEWHRLKETLGKITKSSENKKDE